MSEVKAKVDKVPLTQQLHNEQGALARYRAKAAGDLPPGRFLLYELFALVAADLGGAGGYLLRKWLGRPLFKAFGGGVILGRGLVLRHPGQISLGDQVAVDDYCFLDAGGSGEAGVELRAGVVLSRNCTVQGKTGPVLFEERVDVGCNCVFTSVTGITVGAGTIVAANCYVGGARYHHADLDRPIMEQGIYSRGPISIGAASWIGAGATILDGVRLGRGVIVGAGSVVTGDVADHTIVAGVPAKPIGSRFAG